MAQRGDAVLVRRLKEKDSSAMGDLMDIFGNKIYSLAIGLLRNEQDAEDIVQDTLLQVIEKGDTFREEAALSSWIYRIALNFSYIKIRKNKRDDHLELEEHLPKFQKNGMHIAPANSWPEMTEDGAMRNELAGQLKRSIERLPEKYRVILIMRDIDGLSAEEAADITGMTIPAVKSRLHRARLFLREKLSDYYNG